MVVVAGPCDRAVQSDLDVPSGRRMTRGMGWGRMGDGSGSSGRRVRDEIEREKRQALADPFR